MSKNILRPNWPAPVRVQAAFTTRWGGVSGGPYRTFNLAAHVGDNPRSVTENRVRLRAVLGLPEEPVWLTQVHGSDVAVLNDPERPSKPPDADAAVTAREGRVCAVLTADCLPVLLCSSDGAMVAAAHAGWRGLAAGVLERTVGHLQRPTTGTLAWIGPAIGGGVYEVGDEVREALDPTGSTHPEAFRPNERGRWLADLRKIAHERLLACGVKTVSGGDHCAYTDKRFYSYRRDGDTGRMASIIWISPNHAPADG